MYLDLIPISAQQKNMRHYLSQDDWDIIRRHTYNKPGKHGKIYTCSICGGQGSRHPVEAHEEWVFNGNKITLVDVIPLCPACHKMKHMNFYRNKITTFRALMERYARLTNTTLDIAYTMVYAQFDIYSIQMQKEWELDVESVHSYYNKIKEELYEIKTTATS